MKLYQASAVRAWEQAWFVHSASFGLMAQAAWQMANVIHGRLAAACHDRNQPANQSASQSTNQYINRPTSQHANRSTSHAHAQKIAVWCGVGNNGGDGCLVAVYLAQLGYSVGVYAPFGKPSTRDAGRAWQWCDDAGIRRLGADELDNCTLHIDGLFGIGLDRALSDEWAAVIDEFNAKAGQKIAIDIPSGLHADTGTPMPVAVQADMTLTLIGTKIGLYINQGKSHAGEVLLLPLLPPNEPNEQGQCKQGQRELGRRKQGQAVARLSTVPRLPTRPAHAHKGDLGHVLIIGGHRQMGGAVIMAAMAAMASGAGKATVITHANHHTAVLASSPNLMVQDIDSLSDDELDKLIRAADGIAFGMGLGRDGGADDDWGHAVYTRIMPRLLACGKPVVLDADGLYHLANSLDTLPKNFYLTPHHGEAARLLGTNAQMISNDLVAAIYALQAKYGGQWLIKGAGSLTLENDELQVCPFGNAGMATAGMGDVLAGMAATLLVQGCDFADVVAWHALAGDKLAQHGQIGLMAQDMPQAIRTVMNGG
ncbi:MAG: NAD(P)H-hydrate dehydratase [Moraxella sp.]|nr:NAD(P)H-hydrate dehydratase [Moraxella sp.]